MGKVGGNRNFGYGKKMDWAGKNALADRYGEGHYATRAAHAERWQQFVAYARTLGITDARQIDRSIVERYGKELAEQVHQGERTVSYAQNLLSTVNVVLQTMRGDKALQISPATLVGQRAHVRSSAPAGMERDRVERAIQVMRDKGEVQIATVAALARDLGLRFREASLLDARGALKQAQTLGKINVTEGTKGGRGREVDRWVPVAERAMQSLITAAKIQGDARNLVPKDLSFSQWKGHAHHAWSHIADTHNLRGFHDLRAAYACERYLHITGHPAPAIAGARRASKHDDKMARQIIAQELGHGRTDVAAAYVGSAK
ncbi:MAG: integrase domain-containing protein [Gammaproteobacteria bacterium]|nr:integrase domain-containing protein [Gammaproteobacteria bacterium]